MELDQSIQFVKGVGSKVAALLAKKRIFKVEDALYFFPRAYEDRREILHVKDLDQQPEVCVTGKIKRAYPVAFGRSRGRRYEVILQDLKDPLYTVVLTWFQRPFVFEKLNADVQVIARGKLQTYKGRKQIVHPELEVLGSHADEESLPAEIVPIYSQTEGLYQKRIRKIEKQVCESAARKLKDPLPSELLEKHQLPVLSEAVYQLHCPSEKEDVHQLQKFASPYHQRLIYGELFFFSLVLAMNRRHFTEKTGIAYEKPQEFWDQFSKNLGFKFTAAQKRVVKEILQDMQTARVMHRLVQGDVGSGKTAVAAAAALVALEAGYQVALMAPTEVLISQHFRKFQGWFQSMPIQMVELKGSLKAAERKAAQEVLAQEGPVMAFGTHAIFEDWVNFKNLGLVIVDEQHRFGVRQRARLIAKASAPDVLVMTATPIPRSLALTLYGDLDVSVIDELPPGRKPITTKAFLDSQRAAMNQAIEHELKKGRQVYVVFPLIEESEKLSLQSIEAALPAIKQHFSEYQIEVMHGRMSAAEKEAVLERFRQGEIQMLVSTTVIEVGVDVPNATVMVIENAERFGLSQLHQLRGRVGRGSHESFCFLMAAHMGSAEIKKRLKSMEKTQDGFKLSELDLEMRGPGEISGTRQAGLPEFQLAQLPRDLNWLYKARQDSFELIAQDPQLQSYPLLRQEMQKRFQHLHIS